MGDAGLSWFRLPDGDGAVKEARRFARDRIGDAEPEFADDVLLCVSELLGNAVRHARTHGAPSRHVAPGIWLGVRPRRRWVHLYARDPYPVPPRRRTAGVEDESGRGVFIVSTLTAAFWTDLRRFDKTVHAVLARPGVTLTGAELEGLRR